MSVIREAFIRSTLWLVTAPSPPPVPRFFSVALAFFNAASCLVRLFVRAREPLIT